MVETKLTREAAEDRRQLSDQEWQEIKSKIEEVARSLSHEDLKLIPNPLLHHAVWQLTVDGENTDHRVYLDVRDQKIVVLAIWSFDFTHQGDEHWKELEDRM